MATTITNADMTVTITESVTLNGSNQGATNTLTVAGVDEVFKRIVKCPGNAETTVCVFHSSVADAALAPLDMEHVKYIRITNKMSAATENCIISLQSDINENDSAADQSASIALGAGESFIMGSPNDGIAVKDDAATLVTDMVDLESIVVFTPDADAIDVEVFIASAS